MDREKAYSLVQEAECLCVSDIFCYLKDKIRSEARRGTTHIVEEFTLSDGKTTVKINDWSVANSIGEKVVKELEFLKYNADYLIEQSGEITELKVQVYWGNDTENDYVPLDNQW